MEVGGKSALNAQHTDELKGRTLRSFFGAAVTRTHAIIKEKIYGREKMLI